MCAVLPCNLYGFCRKNGLFFEALCGIVLLKGQGLFFVLLLLVPISSASFWGKMNI